MLAVIAIELAAGIGVVGIVALVILLIVLVWIGAEAALARVRTRRPH